MKGYVYLIASDHGIYVGQTVNLKNRWLKHRSLLRGGKHFNPHLQNAWNKYGESAFEFKVIESHDEIKQEELTVAEQYWIDNYRNSEMVVYNLEAPCNSPALGRTVTESTRQKLSEALKGHAVTDNNRKRLSERSIGNKYSLGRTMSKETREKISRANKGNKYNLGRKLSDETRKKISASKTKKA